MTTHKCSGKAWDYHFGVYPCTRSGTVERGKKWYCWQHDPERIKADEEKREAQEKAKQERWLALNRHLARNAKLAALVTLETAELLERLANEVPVLHTPMKWAGRHYGAGSEIADSARALAASIREVLG